MESYVRPNGLAVWQYIPLLLPVNGATNSFPWAKEKSALVVAMSFGWRSKKHAQLTTSRTSGDPTADDTTLIGASTQCADGGNIIATHLAGPEVWANCAVRSWWLDSRICLGGSMLYDVELA